MLKLIYEIESKLEQSQFFSVVNAYKSDQRRSVTQVMQSALLETLGISNIERFLALQPTTKIDKAIQEVFVSGKNVIIFTFSTSRGNTLGGLFGNLANGTGVQIQVFGSNPSDAAEELLIASEHVFDTLGLPRPEKYLANKSFFLDLSARQDRSYISTIKEGCEFDSPSYDANDVTLANYLREPKAREFLTRLLQVRQLPEAEFTGEVSAVPAGAELLEFLLDNKLVEKNVSVSCRKTSQNIANFKENEIEIDTLKLKCGQCGRLYKDEMLTSVYAPSINLKRNLEKSRWLDILVSVCLEKNGIQKSSIFWRVRWGTSEVDIVALFAGVPVLFELKDTEFSHADALQFNYRRSVVKPLSSLIITTTKISPDAMAVFDERDTIAGSTILSGSVSLPKPEIIDDLQNLETGLMTHLMALSSVLFRHEVSRSFSRLDSILASTLDRALSAEL